MTIYLVLGLAAAVIGLVIGRTAVGAARRGAANPEQAVRQRYAVLLAFMVLGAALLTFDAVETGRHRYVNLVRSRRSWSAASPLIGFGAGGDACGRNG
jgi:hypothetical protein